MKIVRPGDPDYDKDRVISNARFDYRPSAIYYCANAGDVKKAIAQYQAWWQSDAARLDKRCIAWIENFRKTMAPYTDGAFINFVDRDIPLAEYYKDKLPRLLVEVKRQWDPGDFFRFEMSIPLR